MTAECVKVKRLRDLQDAFVVQTGSESWEEAKQKYPYEEISSLCIAQCNDDKYVDSPQVDLIALINCMH